MSHIDRDISGYSQEIQNKIMDKRKKDEEKIAGYGKARTMMAIGMTLLTLTGPIGMIIGLTLVISSVKYDSSNWVFVLGAFGYLFFLAIAIFFTLIL